MRWPIWRAPFGAAVGSYNCFVDGSCDIGGIGLLDLGMDEDRRLDDCAFGGDDFSASFHSCTLFTA